MHPTRVGRMSTTGCWTSLVTGTVLGVTVGLTPGLLRGGHRGDLQVIRSPRDRAPTRMARPGFEPGTACCSAFGEPLPWVVVDRRPLKTRRFQAEPVVAGCRLVPWRTSRTASHRVSRNTGGLGGKLDAMGERPNPEGPPDTILASPPAAARLESRPGSPRVGTCQRGRV